MKRLLLLILISCTACIANAQMVVQVGTGETYPTLKSAIDAINSGLLYGDVELQITSNLTETATPILNNSGVGDAYYTSIIIYPVIADCVIESTAAGANQATILFNGANNVTIDGRLNGSGAPHNLTLFHNGSTNSPTIRFQNRSRYNTIQYCNIEHPASAQNIGIILLDQVVDTSIANAHNTIQYNNIEFTNSATYGINMIVMGNNAHTNVVHGNNFINFIYKNGLFAGAYSATILINGNTFGNEVTENSFYLTDTVKPVNSIKHTAIHISGTFNSSVLTPNVVEGNYIGGSAPLAGGSPMIAYAQVASTGIELVGILAEGDNASSVYYNVQNNTITNLKVLNNYSTDYGFIGIYNKWGKVNIADNTIGGAIGHDYIELTSLTNNNDAYGILIENASPVVSGNIIGGITLTHLTSNKYMNFAGIRKVNPRHYGPAASPTGHPVIQNNFIGSDVTPHSIRNTSTGSTLIFQYTTGIDCTHTESLLIDGNTIKNLTNYSNKITNVDSGGAFGVVIKGNSSATINNNIISDITGTCSSTSSRYGSATGILLHTSVALPAMTISGNEIRNIISTNSGTAETHASGVSVSSSISSGTAHNIANNFIYNVEVNSSHVNAHAVGIRALVGDITARNNVIALMSGTGKVYGICDPTPLSSAYARHNTIYISGAPTLLESACLLNVGSTINNILYNEKSVPSGNPPRHYAFRSNTAMPVHLTQTNNYYVANPSTGGRMIHYNGVIYEDITSWQAAYALDTASISVLPEFEIPGGLDAIDYKVTNHYNGITVSDVPVDFDSVARTLYTIGAFEFSGTLALADITLELSLDNKKQVNIEFGIIEEKEVAEYVIEYSFDAKNWAEMTTIQATGATHYQFLDDSELTHKKFYRIKAIHKSGIVKYSTVKWIEAIRNQAIIYPNPASDHIQIVTPDNRPVKITIYNTEGRILHEIDAYTSNERISISEFPQGLLFIQVTSPSHSEVYKIHKHK